MYKKQQKILSFSSNLSNYVEGSDIYNSYLLQRISDSSLTRELYQITTYEFRPDLIAQDFYGDANYMGILLAQIKIGVMDLKRGVVLSLLPKNTIDNIIENL
jgi:hypothetical protein